MDLNLDLISILASSGATVPRRESSRLVSCVQQLRVLSQGMSATVEVAKHGRKMGEMRPELQGWTGISKVTPITIGCFLIITFSCTSLWISHSKMKQNHLKVTKKICIFTLYCFAVTCNPYFPSLFCIINAKFLFQVISALWVLPP